MSSLNGFLKEKQKWWENPLILKNYNGKPELQFYLPIFWRKYVCNMLVIHEMFVINITVCNHFIISEMLLFFWNADFKYAQTCSL